MALARTLAHLAQGAHRSRGRGTAGRRRATPMVLLAVLATLVAGAAVVGVRSHDTAARPLAAPARHSHHPRNGASTSQLGNRAELLGAKVVNLPAAAAPPVAAPAALVGAPPLATRENFAFAPYWTLAQSPSFDLAGLSTLAYFSVGVNPDGSLDESGPGWNGFESQDLATLITRAHASGERVVLTVNDFGQSSLDALTSSATAPGRLAGALVPQLQAKNLDGVNFDFEGSGSRDQAGLTALVASVSGALRAADPHWQITMDTYASSAGDAGGFYNIPALAQSVDAFFVMAYELNLAGTPSPASPLTSGMFSDAQTLAQYTAVVPAAKVILGTPFFGIDWPTDNGTLGATAAGPASDIADALVQGSTEPQYWDPVTQTAWTSYQVGSQWHESYFENPYGLYLVALLAAHDAVRGVGIWALGMEDQGPQMIAALDGFAPPGGPGGTGPAATSSSPAISAAAPAPAVAAPPAVSSTTTTKAQAVPSTTTARAQAATSTTTTAPVTTALYDGQKVTLTPVGPANVNTLTTEGAVTDFQSTTPAFSCLNGAALVVYSYGLLSGKKVAVARTPTDCVTQNFTFPG